jgi:hypothetical protein
MKAVPSRLVSQGKVEHETALWIQTTRIAGIFDLTFLLVFCRLPCSMLLS